MMESKNNNSFLRKQSWLIGIVIAIAGATWAISATVHSTKSQANITQSQVIDLKTQQETQAADLKALEEISVSKDLLNDYLTLLDKRFHIMEKQLDGIGTRTENIERLLMEQKK